jgi:hypothetical protein
MNLKAAELAISAAQKAAALISHLPEPYRCGATRYNTGFSVFQDIFVFIFYMILLPLKKSYEI